MCWVFARLILSNQDLFGWHKGDIKTFIGFCRVYLADFPPLDVAISSSSNETVLFLQNDFDHSIMQRGLVLYIQNQVGLDELTLPNDESSVFSARNNFSVWQFVKARHIGQLKLTELGRLTLKLETSECLSHLPESDVALSRSEQDVIRVW